MSRIDRRQFLSTALAGAGALALGSTLPGAAAAAAPATRPAGPFALVPLGRTGLRTSLVGFGTGMNGGMRNSNQTRLGAEKFEALLKHAHERGVRLYDLADLYGSHAFLARAFRGLPRDRMVIVSKLWVRPGGIPEKERLDANVLVDRFRKELDTDYIDIVQLHCMTSAAWPQEQKRQMDLLAELKSKGIIRAHGISSHSMDALKAAAATPWCDVVHARINAFGAAMDGKPEQVAPLLKAIHDAGKAVIGMKLVGNGAFRNDPAKRDESIRYVLSLGSVDAMIVGFEKPEELDDFAQRTKAALG